MATQLRHDGLGDLPDEFMTLYQAFLAGQAPLADVRALLERMLADSIDAAPTIQERLDMDMRVGLLGEHSWEALTAEIDQAISEDAPTQWADELPPTGSSPAAAPPEPAPMAPAPPGPLGPGSVLRDRFVLVSRIRSGSMGDVFKALDRRKKEAGAANPWVAIKVISQAFSRHPAALQALQHEAANGQRLSHPNVVHVFDFDRDGDHFYITMEWLEGESLVELLDRNRQQPLPARQAWPVIAGLGRALAHAHAQGVVHADVKPGNVFVTHDGEVKLLDFGIARAANDAGADFDPSVIGAHTPAWSSCEVLEGAEPTATDDVYACAAVAYRVLSGRRPYGQMTALEAEAAGTELEPVPGLSDGQMDALRHALAFRREQRTADAVSLLAELLPRPRHEPSAPAAPPRSAARPRFDWRRPAGLGLAVALAIVLLTDDREPAPPAQVTLPDTAPQAVPAAPAAGGDTARDRRVAAAESDAARDRRAARAGSAEARDRPATPAGAATTSPEAASQPPADSMPASPAGPAPPLAASAPAARGGDLAADDSAMPGRPDRPADSGSAAAEAPPAEPDSAAEARAGPTAASQATAPPAAPRAARASEPVVPAPRDSTPATTTPATSGPALRTAATATLARAAPADEPEPDAGAPAPGAVPALDRDPADYGPKTAPAPQMVPLSDLEFDRYAEPRFPRRGIARGESGWVTVQFRVTASGETADVEVINAEPAGLFEDAALKAVNRWRFKPVIVEGAAAERMSTVRLRFEQR